MVADLEPFFDRVRALFPDTRGHGLSSRFERVEDYTYARKAEDLLLWLDGLGIREAVWGGASMGGALSLWLAVHAPARVRGVVSISGPPFEPSREDKAWWARQRPLVEAGRFAEYFDANLRLRMGEDALARLKARPDPLGLTGPPPLEPLAAGAARRDVQPPRVAGGLPPHPLPGAGDRGLGGQLSHRGHVPPRRRDHPGRPPARGRGRPPFPEPHPPRRGPARDRRVPHRSRPLTGSGLTFRHFWRFATHSAA